MLGLIGLNELPVTDIVLFIVLAAIIGIAVAIYFLIPVFNKKQYQEQRDNLRMREKYFKSNSVLTNAGKQTAVEDVSSDIEAQQVDVDIQPKQSAEDKQGE